jgi:hypothetical protein
VFKEVRELLIFRDGTDIAQDWQGPHMFLGTKPMRGSSRKFAVHLGMNQFQGNTEGTKLSHHAHDR